MMNEPLLRQLTVGDPVMWESPEDEELPNNWFIQEIASESGKVANLETPLILRSPCGHHFEEVAACELLH